MARPYPPLPLLRTPHVEECCTIAETGKGSGHARLVCEWLRPVLCFLQLWRSVKEQPEGLQGCLDSLVAAQQALKEALMRLEMELVEQLDVGPFQPAVLYYTASDPPPVPAPPGDCQGV